MMALEADTDLEVLGLGFRRRRQHSPHARSIRGHRLFHEHVLALLHRFLEVEGTESRRRREDDHVGEGHRLLVAVKAHELALGRNIHLGALGLLDVVQRAFQPVLEGVRHRHELGSRDIQRLVCSAGSAATATDQRDLQGVARLREGQPVHGQRAGSNGTDRDTRG